MSIPDYIVISRNETHVRFDGFQHRLVLRPISDAGRSGQSGAFLIEPGCAPVTLNDPALDAYLKAKIPVLLFARKARDLRPFLRRSESFVQRGFRIEAMP
jgi:hypothetical protein